MSTIEPEKLAYVIQRRSSAHRKRYRGMRISTKEPNTRWRGPWRRYQHQVKTDIKDRMDK